MNVSICGLISHEATNTYRQLHMFCGALTSNKNNHQVETPNKRMQIFGKKTSILVSFT